MKFSTTYCFSLLLAFCAAANLKSVVISYPEDTPNHILGEAMNAIKEAGGIITHEFRLIKGFAADVPAHVMEIAKAWETHYHAVVEEDQIVSTQEEVA